MKKEIIDIPEVNLSDVKEFWVLGSQYKDGILGEYNLKTDLKAAVSGGGSDGDGAVPTIDLRSYAIPQLGNPTTILDIEIPKVDEIVVLTQEGSQIYRKQAIPEDNVELEEYRYSFIYQGNSLRLNIIKATSDESLPQSIQDKWLWHADRSGMAG